MSAPFTSPTPWTHRDMGGAETIIDGHGRTVAILTRGMEPGNGAVIAAGPDLLDVVRGFVAICDGGPVPEGLYATTVLLGHARAVIAKVDFQ